MFCKNCGNEMKDGAKFCDKCGTTIEQSKFSFETGAVAAENKHLKMTFIGNPMIFMVAS